jgi:hypothetical protein
MTKRWHFEHRRSLRNRLSVWSKTVRAQADQLRAGPERDIVIRKARQADTAAHLNDWANSLELQPPK